MKFQVTSTDHSHLSHKMFWFIRKSTVSVLSRRMMAKADDDIDRF